MAKSKGIFVAATGQHVGKSTLCLGIIAGLKKRYKNIGFLKPVGQEHVQVESGSQVDKDVVLFKEQFRLKADYEDMSPVIVPSGFTRRYLDGDFDDASFLDKITKAYEHVTARNDYTVVEGTGHVGVGTIIGLNNARIAAALGLDVIIICQGGLGSSLDELALNITLCHHHGARVRGVILNRVLDSKRKMLLNYFPRALQIWDIPLIGAIPYSNFLGTPSMRDFAQLFRTQLIAGDQQCYRHFKHTRLVAGSLDSYRDEIFPNQLIITPASREDIIAATLETHQLSLQETGVDFEGGMILTGRRRPCDRIVERICEVDLPTLYAPLDSYTAMKKITSFIAKTGKGDVRKVEKAIALVESHINFDILCE